MRNKRQDYLSTVFRNLGFALFIPFGSLLFQWMVFKKDIFSSYFYFTMMTFLSGSVFIVLGYIILREKEA